MKIFSPRTHGYLDFLTVVIFLLAPTVLGLSDLPAYLSYGLAVVHLIVTLVSDFPFGIAKVIPFYIHGWIERIVGPVLIMVPFILGFDADTVARNFYVVMGAIIIAVGILTDYRGVGEIR
ncbi:MAG: hypothetical protein E6Q61_01405 [Nitrosomonas sp.]|nr:MAG: hypothetical protein E6Q61_01405 [Nitrosomonas sp.]